VLRSRILLSVALVALAMLCAFALSGCGDRPAGTSLFPLEAGHRWNYRVTTELEDNSTERETMTLSTLGAEPLPLLDGREAWRRRSDSGVEYWLREDATGIYRVASKSDLEPEPQFDQPQRFVLKAPYAVGTQWQSSTTAYLLMRKAEFPREIRHTHPRIPMLYQIESTDASVDTPAGHFDRCVRVKGTATVRLYADPTSGWRDVVLSTLEWYCPGVGLTRLERDEPANSPFLVGGRMRMELVSWH
jgi:hypothetical protein